MRQASQLINANGGTATAPYGYTNSAGTTTLGKSTVLVWQLGSARASSQYRAATYMTEDCDDLQVVGKRLVGKQRATCFDWKVPEKSRERLQSGENME